MCRQRPRFKSEASVLILQSPYQLNIDSGIIIRYQKSDVHIYIPLCMTTSDVVSITSYLYVIIPTTYVYAHRRHNDLNNIIGHYVMFCQYNIALVFKFIYFCTV